MVESRAKARSSALISRQLMASIPTKTSSSAAHGMIAAT
jgi:hypothetical protein